MMPSSKRGRVFRGVFLCMLGTVLITLFYFLSSSPNHIFLRTTVSEKAETVRQIVNLTEAPTWPTPPTTHGDVRAALVAIGGGLSLRNFKTSFISNFKNKSHLMHRLLPSFCRTVKPGNYTYGFYFAYDYNDPHLSTGAFVDKFRRLFDKVIKENCDKNVNVTLNLIKCDHTKKPTWAQNDAMLQAYLEGAEYFYRINDDTEFVTKDWTQAFVKQLSLYNPPNVGVVGPKHDWGNLAILTYDFVHRTHIELFGYYYPREFTDWYADNWITTVYEPNRSKKLSQVKVKHTHELGTRYRPDHSKRHFKDSLRDQGKQWIKTYVRLKKEAETLHSNTSTKEKAIIFVVSENRYDVIFGCIRNAQLAKVLFPTWLVRVFITDGLLKRKDLSHVLTTLQRLGVDVVKLTPLASQYNVSLVQPSVQCLVGIINSPESYILVRDAEFRLSEREKSAVDEWVQSNYTLHSIRDHSSHHKLAVVPNLWGLYKSKSSNINLLLVDLLKNLTSSSGAVNKTISDLTLSQLLFTGLNQSVLYHNSISISNASGPNVKPLQPVPSSATYAKGHYIGQKFNWNMLPKT